jgi:MFS family permease
MQNSSSVLSDGYIKDNSFWKKNLYVCLFGSFSTVVAMTSLLPFLPLYVGQLGVTGHSAIVQWSGIAYSVSFMTAALVAPLWGRLADRYGRKSMLVRASLGMVISTALMGMAQNIWQLALLRALAGLAGGYSSGATILIATQTPKERRGWALGLLSSGVMAGNLAGPLIGGILPPVVGIRGTFWIAACIIFITFIITTILIKEDKPMFDKSKAATGIRWSEIPEKRRIIAMLITAMLLMLAIMSIEPILTVYVSQILVDKSQLTLIAGIIMSASSLGSILSAAKLGKLADKIGYLNVIFAGLLIAAALLIPQAFVTASWQLIGLRFLMGLALGGLLPCITSYISHNVPKVITSQVLGYSLSFQFAGQVAGPLLGGFIGGHLGMQAVFFSTAIIMTIGAANVWSIKRRV